MALYGIESFGFINKILEWAKKALQTCTSYVGSSISLIYIIDLFHLAQASLNQPARQALHPVLRTSGQDAEPQFA